MRPFAEPAHLILSDYNTTIEIVKLFNSKFILRKTFNISLPQNDLETGMYSR